jgi:hypothetical protein
MRADKDSNFEVSLSVASYIVLNKREEIVLGIKIIINGNGSNPVTRFSFVLLS